jgi:hypothetical protein
MPHFWLTYRNSGRLRSVFIVDAPSPRGYELGADLVAHVPSKQIGRMLTGREAEKLLARFERSRPKANKRASP